MALQLSYMDTSGNLNPTAYKRIAFLSHYYDRNEVTLAVRIYKDKVSSDARKSPVAGGEESHSITGSALVSYMTNLGTLATRDPARAAGYLYLKTLPENSTAIDV